MKPPFIVSAVATLLFLASASNAQAQGAGATPNQSAEGRGQAIVTVMPSNSKDSAEQKIQITQRDIKEIKVAGKPSQVTGWIPLRDQALELILLIDSSTHSDFGNQLSGIKQFVQELPSHTQMSIAWMQNGRAVLASPLSSDPAEISKGIRLPSGMSGANSSPYFSLSDLAKNWPSQNRRARREVVMISDGIDDFNPRYDPNDPYVQAAINDSVRSGMVIYTIFWPDSGRLSQFGWAQDAGQNLLNQLAAATGGKNFWQGTGSPVSLDPYFKDLRLRLNNQYAVIFTAPMGSKPSVERFDFKLSVPSVKVDAPQRVLIQPITQAER
jgi:hypothetical protein